MIILIAATALFDFETLQEICGIHCNFWSKMTPSTLIVVSDFIVTLLIVISIGVVSWLENRHRQVYSL